MKRLMLCTALMLISATGILRAQEVYSYGEALSPTEQVFTNCTGCYTRIKDIVILRNSERMTLRLFRMEDYKSLKNIDSVLMDFMQDISFYKDSLENGNITNVTIDYIYDMKTKMRKIRFKRYSGNGQSFVKQNNDVSKLKIEQDTIHIVLEDQVPIDEAWNVKIKGPEGLKITTVPSSSQVTFVLNDYKDIDHFIRDKAEVHRIIDTLEAAKQHLLHGTHNSFRSVSSIYRPYLLGAYKFSDIRRYKEFSGIIKNEDDRDFVRKPDYLTIDFNIGASLVRNTFAPTADLGLQVIKSWRKFGMPKDNNFFGIYFQPIFFFDRKANGDFITNTNGFVNFHYGAETENTYFGLKLRKASFGVGYLVLNKGDYFKKNTFKLFSDFQLKNGFTLSPELIITDNGKQVFPGLTLKVF